MRAYPITPPREVRTESESAEFVVGGVGVVCWLFVSGWLVGRIGMDGGGIGMGEGRTYHCGWNLFICR